MEQIKKAHKKEKDMKDDGKKVAKKEENRKQLYPLFSLSNIKLFLFATILIVLYTVYQKLCFIIFTSEAWHLLDHFMRIMINQVSHQ